MASILRAPGKANGAKNEPAPGCLPRGRFRSVAKVVAKRYTGRFWARFLHFLRFALDRFFLHFLSAAARWPVGAGLVPAAGVGPVPLTVVIVTDGVPTSAGPENPREVPGPNWL